MCGLEQDIACNTLLKTPPKQPTGESLSFVLSLGRETTMVVANFNGFRIFLCLSLVALTMAKRKLFLFTFFKETTLKHSPMKNHSWAPRSYALDYDSAPIFKV